MFLLYVTIIFIFSGKAGSRKAYNKILRDICDIQCGSVWPHPLNDSSSLSVPWVQSGDLLDFCSYLVVRFIYPQAPYWHAGYFYRWRLSPSSILQSNEVKHTWFIWLYTVDEYMVGTPSCLLMKWSYGNSYIISRQITVEKFRSVIKKPTTCGDAQINSGKMINLLLPASIPG